jgi:hypothetical protein
MRSAAADMLASHASKVDGATYYGLPFAEMTREELLGVIALLIDDQKATNARHQHERTMLLGGR